MLGAIFWNLLTWYYGIPSSSSHALIGGIVGAVWAHEVLDGKAAGEALSGAGHVEGRLAGAGGARAVADCGLVGGFVLMIVLLWICRGRKPEFVNRAFRRLQLVSAAFMAFAHGSNDAQKSMGIITMALAAYAAGHSMAEVKDVPVPTWVIISCATAMALGTASGGWRIMKTMGHKIIRLRPINGFAAETAAATVILAASSTCTRR